MKSVVSYPNRGTGGNNKYRGNCSPKLIEDIINQYHVMNLNDFMCGSGTTEDVCNTSGIESHCYDLNRGFDMISMDIPVRSENIMWHPPYDDIITYSDSQYSAKMVMDKYGFDPRLNDLSRCGNWDTFVKKMNYCTLKQYSALDKGGRMFILMGEIKKKGKLYSMLCDIAKPGTVEQIIIKMQHNCFSEAKSYIGSFVPIVHEYLLVLRKDYALVFDVSYSAHEQVDVRDKQTVTWRDVVYAVLEEHGRQLPLSNIYRLIEGHKKCDSNKHWKEKIRQVLQTYPQFTSCKEGIWGLAA